MSTWVTAVEVESADADPLPSPRTERDEPACDGAKRGVDASPSDARGAGTAAAASAALEQRPAVFVAVVHQPADLRQT